jgi:hypothetical protein
MSIGDGKAKSIVEYLNNLAEKGKASQGAVRPLGIAVTKVMEAVDGEGWQNVDVKNIDVEDYMSRFANLTMGTYSSGSLTTYKSRFGRALGWYLQFLEKPGWTPNIGVRKRAIKKANEPNKAGERYDDIDIDQVVTQTLKPGAGSIVSTDLVRYPFPLASGQMAEMYLPANLSKFDAKRLSAFLDSVVLDKEEVKM